MPIIVSLLTVSSSGEEDKEAEFRLFLQRFQILTTNPSTCI